MNETLQIIDFFFLEFGEISLLNEAVLPHTQGFYHIHLQKVSSAVYKVVTTGETSQIPYNFWVNELH